MKRIFFSCFFFAIFLFFGRFNLAQAVCNTKTLPKIDIDSYIEKLSIDVDGINNTSGNINPLNDTVFYDQNGSYYKDDINTPLCIKKTQNLGGGSTSTICENINSYTWRIKIKDGFFTNFPKDCKTIVKIKTSQLSYSLGFNEVSSSIKKIQDYIISNPEIELTKSNISTEAPLLFLPNLNSNKSIDFYVSVVIGNNFGLLNTGNFQDAGEYKTLKFIKMQERSIHNNCQIDFDGLDTDCNGVAGANQRCTNGASVNSNISIKVTNLDTSTNSELSMWKDSEIIIPSYTNTKLEADKWYSLGNLPSTTDRGLPYWFSVKAKKTNGDYEVLCRRSLPVVKTGETLIAPGENQNGTNGLALTLANSIPLCQSIPDNIMCGKTTCRKVCEACEANNNAIWTGLGCLPTNVEQLVTNLFNLFSGIVGAFLVFCFISNGIRIMVSQNKPETIKKASEAITSCIVGLLVLIFAYLILKIIGVDLLKIPGWSAG